MLQYRSIIVLDGADRSRSSVESQYTASGARRCGGMWRAYSTSMPSSESEAPGGATAFLGILKN